MNKFPNKWWTKGSIKRPLKKLRDTGTVNKLTVLTPQWQTTKCCTEENVDLVNDLVPSQGDMPQTRKTVQEISR